MEKKRFCSKCGSELDEYKVCTGCGKKYFSAKKLFKGFHFSTISVALNIILIVALCILSVMFYQNRNDLDVQKGNYNTLATQYNNLNAQYNDLNNSYNLLKNKSSSELEAANQRADNYQVSITKANTKIALLETTIEIYQKDFAYRTPVGSKYHKNDCYHLNDSDIIYVDCIYDLERQGYTACYDCY